MSLSSIVILLQLVLQLLSQPGASSNPQIQTLASQAITLATQALVQNQAPAQVAPPTISYSIPISPDNSQPIVINVTNPPSTGVGGPDLGSVQTPAVEPSCSLIEYSAIPPGALFPSGSATWTSEGLPNGEKGILSKWGGQITKDHPELGTIILGSSLPQQGSQDNFQVGALKLTFGNVVCYAAYDPSLGVYPIGTSTLTLPPNPNMR